MDSTTSPTSLATAAAAAGGSGSGSGSGGVPPPVQAQQRPRITNACEACRAAKVKCQASGQFGICRRCLDSKRECIFKTGPRTRRPRQSKRYPPFFLTLTTPSQREAALAAAPGTNPPPSTSQITTSGTATATQPGGPPRTFTIDIPMPTLTDPLTDAFEALSVHHVSAIERLGYSSSSSSAEDEDMAMHNTNGMLTIPPGAQQQQDLTWATEGSVISSMTADSLPVGASAISTPPSSLVASHSSTQNAQGQATGGVGGKQRTMAAALGLRPQFNLDSAGGLLATFRDEMLPHFPCIVIDKDGTVTDMARQRPFVLLATLAAASSSRTLQGHSLYDEEFRKILGLKFVAGGERSKELLEGLVVYVCWYPFHLRPTNKQAFQYVRMAVDIINDLEIDQDDTPFTPTALSPERLQLMRLYLATYYIASHYATAWSRPSAMPYTAFTVRCVDFFLAHQPMLGDAVLAWKVRLQRLSEETNEMRRRRSDGQTEYQVELMVKGIESQINEWESKMPREIATSAPIRVSLLFSRVFIIGAPLLKLPRNASKASKPDFSSVDPSRLAAAIPHLHALFDYFAALPAGEINAFASGDWGSMILGVILGYRMSFPLPTCPGWDDGAARKQLRFGEYLDRLCRMGGDGRDADEIGEGLLRGRQGAMDVLGASKIVLGMLRKKYNKRVAKLEKARQPKGIIATMWAAATGSSSSQDPVVQLEQQQQQQQQPGFGCPMLDGSLEPYFPYWDETFARDHLGQHGGGALGVGGGMGMGGDGMGGMEGMEGMEMAVGGDGLGGGGAGAGATAGAVAGQQQYPDLWATISMGWARDGSYRGM
ncbi:hypothetical protein QBC47DRAFT_295118 [Echria macrotheca]|uniref:Zn(2)-C6 fungal-type domain-containing protein n=1 Tax=Echria macrotheca TaxID=438768 RepID=A0AAJ0F858_9PEZI|nr:hypothetical protein QBC47DRAFT_295118 [Echria macrotheca]